MMTQLEALETLAGHRGEAVLISTMGSSGIWPSLSDTPLDFAYIPSSMGQGISLGLGLALAQHTRQVIVLMGDGSLLMNLGSLVTVANNPANLRVLLLDNGLYEVTGGQPTVGSRKIDFAGFAQSAGIDRVYHFTEVAAWQGSVSEVLGGNGPVFVWLKVLGEFGKKTPLPPRPMSEQKSRLQQALKI
jgi:thiamine pyrophosphate-dependent acetolactate synthase large subunit-like protein